MLNLLKQHFVDACVTSQADFHPALSSQVAIREGRVEQGRRLGARAIRDLVEAFP
jgi:hypothetical protein